MYLVQYSTGSWDDWTRKPHFVTDDEQVAKRYCKKFNRILKKAKKQYGVNKDGWIMRLEERDVNYQLRQFMVNDFNEATYSIIEVR